MLMYSRPFFMDYQYNTAFLANMADRLSDAICLQTAALNKAHGSVTPVKSTSTMLYLLEHGQSTLMELSRALNYSHQLTALRIKPLEKLGLVERSLDTNDKRRKRIRLTDAGVKDATILRNLCDGIADTLSKKFDALNVDLLKEIEQMIILIERQPLSTS